MKPILRILLFAMAISIVDCATARADDVNASKETLVKKESHMSNATFGNHSALRVPHDQQGRIRAFYHDILGCQITKKTENIDYFRMGDNFFIAFLYEDGTLAESEWQKSIWLEIKSDDVPTLKQKILEFGVMEINSKDKTHLYFKAPGGQVFRLVGTDEDLSKFEK